MKTRDYSGAYSESSLWSKITNFAGAAGKELIERVLTLYECLKDKNTPIMAKSVIVGALGYFISPLDAIPDVIPVVGFSDDLGALAVASAIVAAHINRGHIASAQKRLRLWFGPKRVSRSSRRTNPSTKAAEPVVS